MRNLVKSRQAEERFTWNFSSDRFLRVRALRLFLVASKLVVNRNGHLIAPRTGPSFTTQQQSVLYSTLLGIIFLGMEGKKN